MPFTSEKFFDVFQTYNEATGPASVVLTVLAAIGCLGLIWRAAAGERVMLLVLSVLWAWSGAVYHVTFFSAVNPAAWLFGAAFLIEAAIMLRLAGRRVRRCDAAGSRRPIIAATFMVYALVLYPVLATAEHGYPRSPLFGAPCPVTIFTFGCIFWLRMPWYAAVIPLLWAVLGSSAAVFFGIYADLGLAAAVACYLVLEVCDQTPVRSYR